MFKKFFPPKTVSSTLELKIEGMHCVSCGMNIDGELEETQGVIKAATHYASGKSIITYDPKLTDKSQIISTIRALGYLPRE